MTSGSVLDRDVFRYDSISDSAPFDCNQDASHEDEDHGNKAAAALTLLFDAANDTTNDSGNDS